MSKRAGARLRRVVPGRGAAARLDARAQRGRSHASRRFLSLRGGALHGGCAPSVSLQSLLLLDLPQDGGGRRIRDQPGRPQRDPAGEGPRKPVRLPGQAARCRDGRADGEPRRAKLLPPLRQRAVALGSALARTRPSLRIGDRHGAARGAGTHAPDGGVPGLLGAARARPGRQGLRRVPGRIARAMASAPRTGAPRLSARETLGDVEIRPADRPADIAAIRALLHDYLRESGLDLGFQGFDAELDGLPGDYAPPRGCLLCAQAGEHVVGCVAFRPLDEERCEMKRLFVRPDFRGSALGAALVAAILERAREAGYASMCLDTAPGMERAQALYARFGFSDIARYNDNPIPGVRFMGVALR